MAGETLTIWTVYVDPIDYPGKWVLRGHEVGAVTKPHDHCVVADSLEEIRQAVPRGLVRLQHDQDDDPHIYESWV